MTFGVLTVPREGGQGGWGGVTVLGHKKYFFLERFLLNSMSTKPLNEVMSGKVWVNAAL